MSALRLSGAVIAAALLGTLVACGGSEKDDGFAWKRMESGITSDLHHVAVDGVNAWAVGQQGTILRWDGRAWSKSESGTTKELKRVRVGADGSAWAIGDSALLRLDGTTWRPVEPLSASVHMKDVLPISATLAWGVSDDLNGISIWKWNGTVWEEFAGNADFPFMLGHIWGTDSDFWIAEDNDSGTTTARVNRRKDGQFAGASVPNLSSSDGWTGITGGSDGIPWLLGKTFSSSGIGTIYRRQGDTWERMTAMPAGSVRDLFVISNDRAFASTDQGGVFEWDGTAWKESLPRDPEAVTLNGIAGSSATEIWTVGREGIVLKLK